MTQELRKITIISLKKSLDPNNKDLEFWRRSFYIHYFIQFSHKLSEIVIIITCIFQIRKAEFQISEVFYLNSHS